MFKEERERESMDCFCSFLFITFFRNQEVWWFYWRKIKLAFFRKFNEKSRKDWEWKEENNTPQKDVILMKKLPVIFVFFFAIIHLISMFVYIRWLKILVIDPLPNNLKNINGNYLVNWNFSNKNGLIILDFERILDTFFIYYLFFFLFYLQYNHEIIYRIIHFINLQVLSYV